MTTAHNIYTENFGFDQPFQLNLADGGTFNAEKVLRIIPGRRMVAFGTWQKKPVVAKLFFDSIRAKQHIEKELAGIKILQDNKIPMPMLHYQDVSADSRCQVLFFERIFAAQNIEEIWQERKSLEAIMPQLRSVMLELATQHVLGIIQHDLHLKNFLLTEKITYTLDSAQIELLPKMLGYKASLNNIALLLSQLGAGAETYQEELLRYYAKARGWRVKSDDIHELFTLIGKWSRERWLKYKKKIFRECSNFSYHHDWHGMSVYDRSYAAPEFLKFISYPEEIFQRSDIKILKAGRSSTVVKVTLDQKDFVIKRYNLKNARHYLRRCLRPTRAAVSWRLAQKLKLFHIATAAPAAFIEKRCLGLRGKSYYVTEYVPGQHIGEFFVLNQTENKKIPVMIKRVTEMLKNLFQLGITHGDLKNTNILVNEHEQPLLIDLDGAAEHISRSSLRKAWRKEKQRFLQNFNTQPNMQKEFQRELI